MSSPTEVMIVESVVRGTSSERFFKICYVMAISIATFGWLSSFGWIALKIVYWLCT